MAPGTVQRAITVLRENGLVETGLGQGSRVVESPPAAAVSGDLEAVVRDLQERVRILEKRLAGNDVVMTQSKRPDAP